MRARQRKPPTLLPRMTSTRPSSGQTLASPGRRKVSQAPGETLAQSSGEGALRRSHPARRVSVLRAPRHRCRNDPRRDTCAARRAGGPRSADRWSRTGHPVLLSDADEPGAVQPAGVADRTVWSAEQPPGTLMKQARSAGRCARMCWPLTAALSIRRLTLSEEWWAPRQYPCRQQPQRGRSLRPSMTRRSRLRRGRCPQGSARRRSPPQAGGLVLGLRRGVQPIDDRCDGRGFQRRCDGREITAGLFTAGWPADLAPRHGDDQRHSSRRVSRARAAAAVRPAIALPRRLPPARQPRRYRRRSPVRASPLIPPP